MSVKDPSFGPWSSPRSEISDCADGEKAESVVSSSLIYDPLDRSVTQKGNLRNDQRKAIVLHHQQYPGLSQQKLAKWAKEEFNLSKVPSQATVSNILKRKHEYLLMSSQCLRGKRKAHLMHPKLDTLLCDWVLQRQQEGEELDGLSIKDKAREIAARMNLPHDQKLEFSNGWLDSFKARHGFRSFRAKKAVMQHEKSLPRTIDEIPHTQHTQDAKSICSMEHDSSSDVQKRRSYSSQPAPPPSRSLSPCTIEEFMDVVERTHEDDIYFLEEIGLLYSMPPSKPLAMEHVHAPIPKYFSIAVASSASGSDKLPPLYIGFIHRPKAFGSRSAEFRKVMYRSSQNAVMNAVLLREWIQTLNDRARTMQRSVALIFPAHFPYNAVNRDLSHVKVVVVPQSASPSHRRPPVSLGTALKRRYRKVQLERATDREDNGERNVFSCNILQAMQLCNLCWENIPTGVIKLAYRSILRGQIEQYEPKNADEVAQQEEEAMAIEINLENCIKDALDVLKVRDCMTVSELLSPPMENNRESCFAGLSHKGDGGELVMEGLYCDDEEGQEVVKRETAHTAGRKLAALKSVISLMADEPFKYDRELKTLRRFQSEIRAKQRKATEKYFHSRPSPLLI